MILSHLSMLTDCNYTSWSEDLRMLLTGEPLCRILETNMRMYMNYSSMKKEIDSQINMQLCVVL